MERMVPHTRRHFWSPDKLEKKELLNEDHIFPILNIEYRILLNENQIFRMLKYILMGNL